MSTCGFVIIFQNYSKVCENYEIEYEHSISTQENMTAYKSQNGCLAIKLMCALKLVPDVIIVARRSDNCPPMPSTEDKQCSVKFCQRSFTHQCINEGPTFISSHCDPKTTQFVTQLYYNGRCACSPSCRSWVSKIG